MQRPTLERIHEVMRDSGMVVFESPFDVTLGGIRTKDNASGKFNDWLFASFFTDNGGIFGAVLEGTTDAGLYYRQNPMHIEGTAIIQHGKQYRGVYQYQNPRVNPNHRGHRGQEAFKQIGKIWYWRDADRDIYLEFDGDEQFDNFATNGHDMGTRGENVHTWSAGCWGAVNKNMDLLYYMAKVQIANGFGDKFSYAMLHENMF